MRIAVLAPISWRVPPRHYGPWELFASLLTEGLVSRGHEVTLFATSDSETSAVLSSVIPRGWSEDPDIDPKVAECLHISEVFERASEFDIIHNSFDFLPLTYSGLISTPVITTIHGFSSPQIVPVYEKYNKRTFYVAISNADMHPSLEYLATIHHGIKVSDFTFNPTPSSYLAFFGRIHRDKGLAGRDRCRGRDRDTPPDSRHHSGRAVFQAGDRTTPGRRPGAIRRARPSRGSFIVPGRSHGSPPFDRL